MNTWKQAFFYASKINKYYRFATFLEAIAIIIIIVYTLAITQTNASHSTISYIILGFWIFLLTLTKFGVLFLAFKAGKNFQQLSLQPEIIWPKHLTTLNIIAMILPFIVAITWIWSRKLLSQVKQMITNQVKKHQNLSSLKK